MYSEEMGLPLEIYSFKCDCGHVDVELNEEEQEDRKILSKYDIWHDINDSGEYFCEVCHGMIDHEYIGTEKTTLQKIGDFFIFLAVCIVASMGGLWVCHNLLNAF